MYYVLLLSECVYVRCMHVCMYALLSVCIYVCMYTCISRQFCAQYLKIMYVSLFRTCMKMYVCMYVSESQGGQGCHRDIAVGE